MARGRKQQGQADWRQQQRTTPEALAWGRVWQPEDYQRAMALLPHERLIADVAEIEQSLEGPGRRSVLVAGEPGVGKTSALVSVAAQLFAKGWTVFEAGHMELTAGCAYLGELEERVNRSLPQLCQKNTLWLVGRLEDLAFSGTHRYSRLSALDMILPRLLSGELLVLGEAESSGLGILRNRAPRVWTAFRVMPLAPPTRPATLELAVAWLGTQGTTGSLAKRTAEEAITLAEQFLPGRARPGAAFDLLTAARDRASKTARGLPRLQPEDLPGAVAALTGLPLAVLDASVPLDLTALRAHFAGRVTGQAEAIDCLVERVAMIKAGLTDPGRPYGVFFFAGPTGTGKTEIAKTLAAWLFGGEERLIRVDMSEIKLGADIERLVGAGDGEGTSSLATKVREQPFSVVLLDEFEKAHPAAYDLFLQVFDDGRLTDRNGRTTDFRNCVIVLTSNLGAQISTGPALGFGATRLAYDPAAVARAIEAEFAPEFLNRLDRVLIFQPLTRPQMRQILAKELEQALNRRGLRSKPWAVEIDETAIEFLLDKGFTEHLGARPLRRAVERFFLTPLALTIVDRAAPEGDQFLYVEAGREALRVRFVDPDVEAALGPAKAAAAVADAEAPPSLKAIALAPQGLPGELLALRERLQELSGRSEEAAWQEGRAATLARLLQEDFWQDPARHAALGRVELQDRIEAGLAGARSLLERLTRGQGGETLPLLLRRLALKLLFLEQAFADLEAGTVNDLLLSVAPEGRAEGAELGRFAGRLAAMYRAWAEARGLACRAIAPQNGAQVLRIAGYGAWRVLSAEAGLHVYEQPEPGKRGFRRLTVEVRVAGIEEELPARPAQRSARLKALLEKADPGRRVVRRYREAPAPLVRDAAGGWRSGLVERIFAGDFDLIE